MKLDSYSKFKLLSKLRTSFKMIYLPTLHFSMYICEKKLIRLEYGRNKF